LYPLALPHVTCATRPYLLCYRRYTTRVPENCRSISTDKPHRVTAIRSSFDEATQKFYRELERRTRSCRSSYVRSGCLRTGCPNFRGLFTSKVMRHYTRNLTPKKVNSGKLSCNYQTTDQSRSLYLSPRQSPLTLHFLSPALPLPFFSFTGIY